MLVYRASTKGASAKGNHNGLASDIPDKPVPLREYLKELVSDSADPSTDTDDVEPGLGESAGNGLVVTRFTADLRTLVVGKQEDAAKGLAYFLGLPPQQLYSRMAEGLTAIRREWQEADGQVRECVEYVLDRRAGSWQRTFRNAPYPPDCDANGVRLDRCLPSGEGMALEDFAALEQCKIANLELAHVAALRIYSTAAFSAINSPLRDGSRSHPHPVTTTLLTEALKRLRAVGARASSLMANAHLDLWRGMRDIEFSAEFLREGGTEMAPLSTTTQLPVAVHYTNGGKKALLFKLSTASALERGADIAFLSCFPSEAEILFPPLTYLRTTSKVARVPVGHRVFTVVEVVPVLGT